ncbi:MAG TPA: glycosyltransferase [Candidatus Dormibacteraeota bacterium]|nr:glycosyltransferase [Candidatus Dormibacteraeota bacterium]
MPPIPLRPARAAVVQDWFFAPGGSERCALELIHLLPASDVFTTFFDQIYRQEFEPSRLHTWPLQRILGPTARYRSLLPLYPLWFTMLDLRNRDLVISSSVAFSHAVRTAPSAIHVSYVYTPLRYAWDLDNYLAGSSLSALSRLGARTLRPVLQRWDRATAKRPDVIVAISETVRERVSRLWGRESEVIYPPVETASIPRSTTDDGYLLVAARMLAYRRIDLAVAAATQLSRELVVVGAGPEEQRLRAMAGATVRFLGTVDRATLVDLFSRCHAYVVPGIEDFGIAPVEAMAAGKPVVGFGSGGVAETVVDGVTGVLFDRQDVGSFCRAIERLDGMTFDPAAIRARAEMFDVAVFRSRWKELFARLGVDPVLYTST